MDAPVRIHALGGRWSDVDVNGLSRSGQCAGREPAVFVTNRAIWYLTLYRETVLVVLAETLLVAF